MRILTIVTFLLFSIKVYSSDCNTDPNAPGCLTDSDQMEGLDGIIIDEEKAGESDQGTFDSLTKSEQMFKNGATSLKEGDDAWVVDSNFKFLLMTTFLKHQGTLHDYGGNGNSKVITHLKKPASDYLNTLVNSSSGIQNVYSYNMKNFFYDNSNGDINKATFFRKNGDSFYQANSCLGYQVSKLVVDRYNSNVAFSDTLKDRASHVEWRVNGAFIAASVAVVIILAALWAGGPIGFAAAVAAAGIPAALIVAIFVSEVHNSFQGTIGLPQMTYNSDSPGELKPRNDIDKMFGDFGIDKYIAYNHAIMGDLLHASPSTDDSTFVLKGLNKLMKNAHAATGTQFNGVLGCNAEAAFKDCASDGDLKSMDTLFGLSFGDNKSKLDIEKETFDRVWKPKHCRFHSEPFDGNTICKEGDTNRIQCFLWPAKMDGLDYGLAFNSFYREKKRDEISSYSGGKDSTQFNWIRGLLFETAASAGAQRLPGCHNGYQKGSQQGAKDTVAVIQEECRKETKEQYEKFIFPSRTIPGNSVLEYEDSLAKEFYNAYSIGSGAGLIAAFEQNAERNKTITKKDVDKLFSDFANQEHGHGWLKAVFRGGFDKPKSFKAMAKYLDETQRPRLKKAIRKSLCYVHNYKLISSQVGSTRSGCYNNNNTVQALKTTTIASSIKNAVSAPSLTNSVELNASLGIVESDPKLVSLKGDVKRIQTTFKAYNAPAELQSAVLLSSINSGFRATGTNSAQLKRNENLLKRSASRLRKLSPQVNAPHQCYC